MGTAAVAVDAPLALLLLAAALALRPWRLVEHHDHVAMPWPWLLWWALLPVLWGADRYAAMPLLQPLSGASLLVLMAGWPLAVPAMTAVALLLVALADVPAADALHRLVWLGLVPGTLVLGFGAAMRRWLPRHLFIYIFVRGFFATLLAGAASGVTEALLFGPPHGLGAGELMIGRWLAAWSDAIITGMLVSVFVAFRPDWLATYADRIYLPRD